MKWLLILFLGLIVVPAFAQNITINQTEYQKIHTSIAVIQDDLTKLSTSINQTHSDLKNYHQDLSGNINETRIEAQTEYVNSLIATGSVSIIAFLGGIFVAAWIHKRQDVKQDKIQELVTAIKDLVSKQDELIKDVRKMVTEENTIRKEIIHDISYHLNGHLKTIIMTLEHSLQMYENCKNAKNDEKEHWFTVMKESYCRPQHFLDLKINLLDMMKVFGANISRKYWCLLADLQTTNLLKDMPIDQIDVVAKAIRESLNLAKELKSIVDPLSKDE